MLSLETEKFSAAVFMPKTPPEYSVWTVLPQGDGEALFALLPEPKPALICVSADWNRDLSPWFAPKVFRGGEDFSGGADAFLQNLSENTIPFVENKLNITNCKRIVAGYSLAGLFAVYAFYKSDLFCSGASVSGSLWFDGFIEFAERENFCRTPKRFCFSVGDREKNTKNPRMAAVEDCTKAAAELFRSRGVRTLFELNPGGHFSEPEARLAKGISFAMGK